MAPGQLRLGHCGDRLRDFYVFCLSLCFFFCSLCLSFLSFCCWKKRVIVARLAADAPLSIYLPNGLPIVYFFFSIFWLIDWFFINFSCNLFITSTFIDQCLPIDCNVSWWDSNRIVFVVLRPRVNEVKVPRSSRSSCLISFHNTQINHSNHYFKPI